MSLIGLRFLRSKHMKFHVIRWSSFKETVENLMLWCHFQMTTFVYQESFRTACITVQVETYEIYFSALS